MKKAIAIALGALLPLLSPAQGKRFELKGKIGTDTAVSGIIILSYDDNGVRVNDSTVIRNNSYAFSFTLKDPGVKMLLSWKRPYTKEQRKESDRFLGISQLLVDTHSIRITHDARFRIQEIEGSQMQKEFERLEKTDVAGRKAYINEHPEAWLNWFLLENMLRRGEINPDTDSILYTRLSSAVKERLGTRHTNFMHYRKAHVGGKAPAFTMLDTEGKDVSLEDFRGKYVFLDFWASWCHPCRDENPHVLAAYNKFKDRGFVVLGISLDGKSEFGKKAWLKAIGEDGLPWKQVASLMGGKDEAEKLYEVTSIPDNFLIAPDGTIIATKLRGAALEKKLAEVLPASSASTLK